MRIIREKIRLQNLYIPAVVLCLSLLNGCTSQEPASAATSQPASAPVPSKSPESRKNIVQVKNIETERLDELDDIKPSDYDINLEKAPEKVNSANFIRIKEGMTYEEITRMFGDPGMKVSIIKINDRETLVYKWTTADFKKYIDVTFENNTVVKKAYKGL